MGGGHVKGLLSLFTNSSPSLLLPADSLGGWKTSTHCLQSLALPSLGRGLHESFMLTAGGYSGSPRVLPLGLGLSGHPALGIQGGAGLFFQAGACRV